MHINILDRVYSIRRIPLRLIVAGEPCDCRIDYAGGDILIGDPDGMTRQYLLECVAEAIADVTAFEYAKMGIVAPVASQAISAPASSRPAVVLSGCFQVGLLLPDCLDVQWTQSGPRRRE